MLLNWMYQIGTWSGIKRVVCACHCTGSTMPWHLLEFIWRRKNKDCMWAAIVKALKEVSFHGIKYGEQPEPDWLFTEVKVISMG